MSDLDLDGDKKRYIPPHLRNRSNGPADNYSDRNYGNDYGPPQKGKDICILNIFFYMATLTDLIGGRVFGQTEKNPVSIFLGIEA